MVVDCLTNLRYLMRDENENNSKRVKLTSVDVEIVVR